MILIKNTAVAAMLAVALAAAPALAKDKGNHGEQGGSHKQHEHRDTDKVHFRQGDRVIVRDYLVSRYGRPCPPGLAKKNNGCVPPGQIKKYEVGTVLPDYIIWEPVPVAIAQRLGTVPVGYRYVQVDQNILLINEGTRRIMDGITLLSAVD